MAGGATAQATASGPLIEVRAECGVVERRLVEGRLEQQRHVPQSRRIAGPTILQPGDTIRIGRTDIQVVARPVELAATPQLCLVDPFPDPDPEGQLVTRGTIVDADRGEIWMVVTAESPAEALERPMALFFGSRLPAGRELERLLEGYGLLAGESPDPDQRLPRPQAELRP